MKLDKSMFKGKDIGLVREIIDYFEKAEIDVKISGGVKNNFEAGAPRNYNDIDILVPYEDTQRRNDALWGIVWGINNVKDISIEIPSFVNKTEQDYEGEGWYLDSIVEHRFKVSDKKTNTLVDLCFEEKRPDYGEKTKDSYPSFFPTGKCLLFD